MPAQILTPEQVARYGHYTGEPSPAQLAKYFHLDDRDISNLSRWHEGRTRLGYALQLCAVRFLGSFLSDLTETPPVAIEYVVQQLDLEDTSGWEAYVGSRTEIRHRQFIKVHYGYEEFHRSQRTFTLLRRLYARAWLT